MQELAPPSIPPDESSLLARLGGSNETRIGTTSSSPFTGSPSFDAAPFHVDIGRQPRLGTFVLIQSDDSTMAHYGRVVEGQEENPRAEPGRLQQNQAYRVGQKSPRPSDQAPHVTRVMNVEILGQLRLVGGNLEICEPEVLPQTGMSVYELPAESIPDILNTPKSNEDGLFLGYVESGEQRSEFLLPLSALPRHLAVLGKTGVGKSYFSGVMIEEIARHGIPGIAIDILGDLIQATNHLGGANLKAGENFRIPYSIIGRKEFLEFVPTLTEDQEELVADAYDSIYAEAINTLERTGTVNIPVSRLITEIGTVAQANGQTAVGNRAIAKVQFAIGRRGLLSEGLGSWVQDLIDKPLVNVYVGHLGQGARNLVVGAAARVVQVLRRQNRIPPFAFFLDEAHFFLPGGGDTTPSTQVVRELIRTARHDAVSIILITQSPASLDKQTLMVCNTRVVFALDPDDLRVVSGTMGDLPKPTIERIPKMAKGRAIIASAQDILRHPALVHIRQRQTPEGAPTPNLKEAVQEWHQNKTR